MKKVKYVLVLLMLLTVSKSVISQERQSGYFDFYRTVGYKTITTYAHPNHTMVPEKSSINQSANKITLKAYFKGYAIDFITIYSIKVLNNGLPIKIEVEEEGCIWPSFSSCDLLRETAVNYLNEEIIQENSENYIQKALEELTCVDYCLINLWVEYYKYFKR